MKINRLDRNFIPKDMTIFHGTIWNIDKNNFFTNLKTKKGLMKADVIWITIDEKIAELYSKFHMFHGYFMCFDKVHKIVMKGKTLEDINLFNTDIQLTFLNQDFYKKYILKKGWNYLELIPLVNKRRYDGILCSGEYSDPPHRNIIAFDDISVFNPETLQFTEFKLYEYETFYCEECEKEEVGNEYWSEYMNKEEIYNYFYKE